VSETTPTERYEAKKLNPEGRKKEFNFILDEIEKIKQPPGKILDIGCYEGFFLSEARVRGWDCHGVEPNRGGAAFARDTLHLNIKQCVLENANYVNNCFDVITVLATLEHLPDPLGTLNAIKRILKTNGCLIITVPTIPFYLPLIKSKWRMFIGDHYFFFNDISISKLLNRAGFHLMIPGKYIAKTFDLETMSSRLTDEWQPNNLGMLGYAIRAIVQSLRIGKLSITMNPYDSKLYIARM